MEQEVKRYDEQIKINGAEIRVALTSKNITMTKASKIIGKNETYISECTRRGTISKEALESLCLLIEEKPEKFIQKNPVTQEPTANTEDQEELFKQLDEINGALFEVVNKQRNQISSIDKTKAHVETLLAGMKQLVETCRNTSDMCKQIAESSAEMLRESKRFYEESKKFYSGKKNYDVHGRWQ